MFPQLTLSSSLLGILASIGTAICWALAPLFFQKVLRRGGKPFQANAVQLSFSALCFSVYLAISGRSSEILSVELNDLMYLVLGTMISYGIGSTLFFTSLKKLEVSRAVSFAYTPPLFVYIISVLILNEPISYATSLGVIAMISGIYLVVPKKSESLARQTNGIKFSIIALMAALSYAIAAILYAVVSKGVDPFMANAIRLLLASPLLLLISLPIGPKKLAKTIKGINILWLFIGGFFDSFIGVTLYFIGMKTIGIARSTTLAYASPLFSILFAAILLRERIPRGCLLGIVIIVAGIWLISMGQ